MIENSSEEMIKKVKMENVHFRTLSNKHDELEKKLKEIDKKHYLNTNEEMERKKIQKLKLLHKDKMFRILNQYERNTVNTV